MRIRLGRDALATTLDEILRIGEGRREAAVLWLGDRTDLLTRVVCVPEGPGVEWRPLGLRISEEWMDRLGAVCDQRDLVVLGAAHSHPVAAFFSPVDEDGCIHAPDLVSVVIPNYGLTTIAEASRTWSVSIGLPFGRWREGSWQDEIVLEEAQTELLHLRLDA